MYHATDHWFREIDFAKTSAWTPKTNSEGPGLYFHVDKQSAVSYARSRHLKYVYTVELFAAELEDFTETENIDAYVRRITSVLECETGVDVLPVLENNLRDIHPEIKDWDVFLGCIGGPERTIPNRPHRPANHGTGDSPPGRSDEDKTDGAPASREGVRQERRARSIYIRLRTPARDYKEPRRGGENREMGSRRERRPGTALTKKLNCTRTQGSSATTCWHARTRP